MEILCILLLLLTGIFYWREKKKERAYFDELAGISDVLEKVLQRKQVSYEEAKDDTLYSKILSQIQRLDERNRGSMEALEKERDEIKQLLAEISHQLRTPLTNLETYLALLEENLGDEGEREDYLKAAGSAEQKINFLVEKFILAARLEGRVIQIHKNCQDVKETVAQAVFQVYKKAKEKNIRIRVEESPHMDRMVYHDRNWISEVIYNLLDNSIKYSPVGSEITVFMKNNEMFTEISVEDMGIGIDEGEENRIFQLYYRGNRVSNQEGYGMGLFIVREIVKKHDGFVRVKRKKQGLIMSIFLPKAGT